jgi:hypothetical protein
VKRLALHFLTFCLAVTLVLLLALCVLWARSYSRADWIQYGSARRCVVATSVVGRIVAEWGDADPLLPQFGWRHEMWDTNDRRRMGQWSFLQDGAILGFNVVICEWAHWLDTDGNPNGRGAYRFPLRPRMPYSRPDAIHRVNQRVVTLMIPHWLLALLSALLPAFWLIAELPRRRRRGAGHCPSCGYDLRASPERCPECGTMAASS